jgi:hypothetical protein
MPNRKPLMATPAAEASATFTCDKLTNGKLTKLADA